MKKEYLSVDKLKKRWAYKVAARNFSIGVWDGEKSFIGIRYKFDSSFLDEEIHWDLDSTYGTCTPLHEIVEVPEEIEVSRSSKQLKEFLKELKQKGETI